MACVRFFDHLSRHLIEVANFKKSAIFYQRKVWTQYLWEPREFLARGSANWSPISAILWWRHFRLSLFVSPSLSLSHSLSLSLSLSHRAHLKTFVLGIMNPIIIINWLQWRQGPNVNNQGSGITKFASTWQLIPITLKCVSKSTTDVSGTPGLFYREQQLVMHVRGRFHFTTKKAHWKKLHG